jgi:glycosyltransferase involved in cell wall biosynthesis
MNPTEALLVPQPGARVASSVDLSERPVRVLQLAYGHALYGAERWVLTLIKHLDPRRVETMVAAIRDADTPSLPLIDEAQRLGFETTILEATTRVLRSSIRGLRAVLRSRRIDVVHSHGVRQNVVAFLASRGYPVKLLSTPHGWETRCSLKERARTLLDKAVFRGFDAVAPLSEELRDSMRTFRLPKARVRLIRNGVDLSEVESAVPIEGLLPGQSNGKELVIGYVGQLIPRKGVEVLLEALSRLPFDDWTCLVIGGGPERVNLERMATRLDLEPRVSFLGYRPERLRYLKRLDFLVLPSFREGIPRCLLEALAAGIPCAGSSIPGIDAVLRGGLAGDTFAPGDARQLADIIASHRRDPERGRRQAATGQAFVYEAFSARAMARSYERLYQILVRQVPSAGGMSGVA